MLYCNPKSIYNLESIDPKNVYDKGYTFQILLGLLDTFLTSEDRHIWAHIGVPFGVHMGPYMSPSVGALLTRTLQGSYVTRGPTGGLLKDLRT